MGGDLTGDVRFRKSWLGKIILQVEVRTPDGLFFRDATDADMHWLNELLQDMGGSGTVTSW